MPFRNHRILVSAFFLIYLIIGLFVYKDYGVSWDEPTHRQIALVNAKYLASFLLPNFHPPELEPLPTLAEYSAKQYGVIFDLPMYFAEALLDYNGQMAEAYYLRHLGVFLLFYVSVCFFYLIVRERFDSPLLGIMGCLFLVLSPRFFAESFYGKDIVFFSLFTISIYFFIRYLNDPRLRNSLLFALASALVVDQRITGLFIPVLAIAMTGIDIMKGEKTANIQQKRLLPLIVYLLSFALIMVLFWPYLWSDPWQNFIDSFTKMNKFPFSPPVLYLGSFIKATELPWHYIPLWIVITTPVIYTFFFLLGSAGVIRGIIKNGIGPYLDGRKKQDILFLLLFLTPLVAVLVLRSVLYDGWRHMYFIYAPFLLIAMTGVAQVLEPVERRGHSPREGLTALAVAAVILLSLISTSYQMIRHHPFQNVYFNFLAGERPGENFELDYWGLSFRKGLEYIVENDKRPVVKLAVNAIQPLLNNSVFIDKRELMRFKVVNIRQADYFLTNYRWHPEPYNFNNEVFSIIGYKTKIFSVFKLPPLPVSLPLEGGGKGGGVAKE